MALRIRLKRNGRNKLPVYRIVVTERRWWRNGKTIDDLGSYNPITDECVMNFFHLRYWLVKGAKLTRPSRRVINQAIKRYNELIDLYLQEPFQ